MGNCDNRRIAKNSIMLYIRMLVIMLVSLFTSRVYLQTLGETDFGIFNIVGGLVVLFSFISNTMQLATQRYLNYSMGKNNEQAVCDVFNISMLLYAFVSCLILILAETIGLWFLNCQMNIPTNRLMVANWVYQFALLGFIFQMLRIPYNAAIISKEKMSVYAYFSIIEALLKLGAAMIIVYVGIDKLFLVSLLTMLIYIIMTFIYKIYCNIKYDFTRFRFTWKKDVVKDLASFSGWNLFGSIANLSGNHGVNLILNIFWGVTVNAALGIAAQLTAAVNQLVSNFQTAYNPQLVKLYASGDINAFNKLIFNSSKLSFFLMLYAFIPVYLCADYILKLWLGNFPTYTVEFTKLILCFSLVDAISAPLWLSVQAVGNIRNYQILMSVLIISNLPITFLLMKMGYSPLYAWGVRVAVNVITYLVRIFYLRNLFVFPSLVYIKKVVLPSLLILLLSFILPSMLNGLFEGFVNLSIVTISSFLSTTILIGIFGLEKNEKKNVKMMIMARIDG